MMSFWKRKKVVAVNIWFGTCKERQPDSIAYSSICNLLYPRYGLFKDGGQTDKS
jgi:hypothetical protein